MQGRRSGTGTGDWLQLLQLPRAGGRPCRVPHLPGGLSLRGGVRLSALCQRHLLALRRQTHRLSLLSPASHRASSQEPRHGETDSQAPTTVFARSAQVSRSSFAMYRVKPVGFKYLFVSPTIHEPFFLD